MWRQRTLFCKPDFNLARIIFFEPFLGGKKDSGNMKTPFIGAMDSLVQGCKSDQTSKLKYHQTNQEKGARLLGPPHHICLQYYPLSIRPAVVTEPVPQWTRSQQSQQSHSKRWQKPMMKLETNLPWNLPSTSAPQLYQGVTMFSSSRQERESFSSAPQNYWGVRMFRSC